MNYKNCELEGCSDCYYDFDQEVYKCRVYSHCEVDEDFLCEEDDE